MDHLTQAQDLLADLKMTLRIDGNDDDLNLTQMLIRSMTRLDDLAGQGVIYTQDEFAKELLFNRIRYDYNSALEYWDGNFAEPILAFTLKYGVIANDQP